MLVVAQYHAIPTIITSATPCLTILWRNTSTYNTNTCNTMPNSGAIPSNTYNIHNCNDMVAGDTVGQYQHTHGQKYVCAIPAPHILKAGIQEFKLWFSFKFLAENAESISIRVAQCSETALPIVSQSCKSF